MRSGCHGCPVAVDTPSREIVTHPIGIILALALAACGPMDASSPAGDAEANAADAADAGRDQSMSDGAGLDTTRQDADDGDASTADVPDSHDVEPQDADSGVPDAGFDTADGAPDTGPDDRDDDGVADGRDNCPSDANPDQTDADGDDVGDVCDACPNDRLEHTNPDNCADNECRRPELNNCDRDAVCVNHADGFSCQCPPSFVDVQGDGTDCFYAATAGHVTARDCGGRSGRYYDCGRDPGDPLCGTLGAAGNLAACNLEDASALEACRCVYGREVQRAMELDHTSATGCAVVACQFEPCEGERVPHLDTCGAPNAEAPVVESGDDWTVPEWAEVDSNAGFYSWGLGPPGVRARAVDLSWRQLSPSPGEFVSDQPARFDHAGRGDGTMHDSLDAHLSRDGDLWMRIFATADGWAPEWVVEDCGVQFVEYRGTQHLPLWNTCVWDHLVALYREFFLVRGLRADPALRFVYVPGGFRYAEYGYGLIHQAAADGLVSQEEYVLWFRRMVADLVAIMNGENDDPDDDYAGKLVFTGEDYPYSVPEGWNREVIWFLPREAVAAGMGIRNGITENFNSHHNDQPAYGAALARNGHVVVDESWHGPGNRRIFGTENECYRDCGIPFPPNGDEDLLRAIALSNFKALQARNNWIFVSESSSYLDQFPDHWNWVAHSVGKRPQTAFDGWAVLREARDRFWAHQSDVDWITRPWARNMERFLVQRDVCPDGVSRRGTTRVGDLFYDDTVTYEGRRTDVDNGQRWLYFDLQDDFLHDDGGPVQVKVTWRDISEGRFWLEYDAGGCVGSTQAVTGVGDGQVRTATFSVRDGRFTGGLPGGTDLRVGGGSADLEVRVVRVLKLTAPR